MKPIRIGRLRKIVSGGGGGPTPTVAMADNSVSGENSASVIINANGSVYASSDGSAAYLIGGWLTAGLAADVEVSAARSGNGTLTGNAVNTWWSLASTRSFGISTTTFARSSMFTLTFRDKNTLAVLDTATVGIDLDGNDTGTA